MDISEIGSLYTPENMYASQFAARQHKHPKTVTSNTGGTPLSPSSSFPDGVRVPSNTGPAGSSPTHPQVDGGRFAHYARYIFEEMRLNNSAEILSLLNSSSSQSILTSVFQQLGDTLCDAAKQASVGTVLYHLDGDNNLLDSHAAEGLGLNEFIREDGTFDLNAALAELSLLREGERDPAALEKEASYMDYAAAQRQSGAWDTSRRDFENITAKAALTRLAGEDPGFANAYAEQPAEAVQNNLRPLTNYVMNTTIAYHNGEISAYF